MTATPEPSTPLARLAEVVATRTVGAQEVTERTSKIHRAALENAFLVDKPNFTRIHPIDLERLFVLYDEAFFDRQLWRQSGYEQLSFRLSSRMISAGGKTTVLLDRRGVDPPRYDIAVSTALLGGAFQDDEQPIQICGFPCRDRLEALQRVFEHELVHLIEQWLWQESSCKRTRFRDITQRLFGHTEHTHQLITPRERAATRYGIVRGARVAFYFEGKRYVGIVNRVTKRATVLVETAEGQRYSNGKRYKKFYVPVSLLQPE